MPARVRLLPLILLICLGVLAPWRAGIARAESPADVTAALNHADVYLSPVAVSHGVARTSDRQVLQRAVDRAARAGVDEKIAVISTYPSKYASAQAATVALRQKLGFSGILVVVTPGAIGISNGLLTRLDIENIDRAASTNPRCNANHPIPCAVLAANAAVPVYQDEQAIIQAAGALNGQSVVITAGAIARHLARAADAGTLSKVVQKAQARGVTEKFLFVEKYPEGYSNPTDAANALVKHTGLSGVLILGAPDGIGIGSDLLSSSDHNTIEAQVPSCSPVQEVRCAALTGTAAIPVYRRALDHQHLVDTIILLVVLAIVLLIIALVIWYVLHKRAEGRRNLEDMRQAARNTLDISDRAVTAIETQGTNTLAPEVSKAYNAALALRQRASDELDKAGTAEQLTQANQDAALAALSFQGVLTRLKLPLGNDPLLDAGPHRCFYCGRTDRPPYSSKTIKDDKGHSMTVDVCKVDQAILKKGQKPKIETVKVGRQSLPWWAVNTDPYYYRYGGVGWQYWLPYTTGVNMGQWYGGASNGSYSRPPAAKQDWSGGGDRDTTSDVAAGHLSGTSTWGGSGGSSSGDW